MRAILINPFDRTVSAVDIEPGLRAMYEALSGPGFPKGEDFPTDPAEWGELEREPMNVHCIDILSLTRSIDMVIDDNGRCSDYQACFALKEMVIAGRALIVGNDHQGGTCGTPLSLDLVKSAVRWLKWDYDYTPDAPTIITFNSPEMLKFLMPAGRA